MRFGYVAKKTDSLVLPDWSGGCMKARKINLLNKNLSDRILADIVRRRDSQIR
jgi:hypothetical protein